MIVAQSDVDKLLRTLKNLLEQIATLRERVTELESEMKDELNQAKQEYDERLGPLNADAAQLINQKALLQARLAQMRTSPTTTATTNHTDTALPDVVLPEAVLPRSDTPTNPPDPPPVDPRLAQKRALADHIYYFLDSDQEPVMQVINAMLADDSRDMGHMLESLAWGEIWAIRADWESLEEQYNRLKGWQSALESRLAHWKAQVQRLESESRYSLWEIKSQGEEKWQVFLDELVQKQTAENARLTHEIAILEQELQAQNEGEERAHG
jgi:chromosome segregation ATPase